MAGGWEKKDELCLRENKLARERQIKTWKEGNKKGKAAKVDVYEK